MPELTLIYVTLADLLSEVGVLAISPTLGKVCREDPRPGVDTGEIKLREFENSEVDSPVNKKKKKSCREKSKIRKDCGENIPTLNEGKIVRNTKELGEGRCWRVKGRISEKVWS